MWYAATVVLALALSTEQAAEIQKAEASNEALSGITLECRHVPGTMREVLWCELRNASETMINYVAYNVDGPPVEWTQWQSDSKWEGPVLLDCGAGLVRDALAPHEMVQFDVHPKVPRDVSGVEVVRVGLRVDPRDGKGERWTWSGAVRITQP